MAPVVRGAVMKPGDFIQLPDGRQGFFQSKLPSGEMVILTYSKISAEDAKKAKVVK